ncbi:RT0821/Lpp0805 family surface protein [Chthonobacter rhizosphaerae]|uniref:RT0821/Lpp0805 family surface protein n=1 Tax=Chthonobacter rhizosphaerae TaxID=2735553 RepID=UPI001FEC64F6|nr:RT0821/Lpp0805 family surface protein [Chthonobacter rhizosphaerae]
MLGVKKMIAVSMVGVTLAGCASDPTVGQKASLGTLAGAVGGAAIGSAFGSGSGRIAAVAAGALIGGFVGNQIGARMDEQDRQYYYASQVQALNTGAPQRWSNPQTGVYGDVQTGPTYYVNNSQCREYVSTIYIDGRPETARGQACRNPDGSWRPVG